MCTINVPRLSSNKVMHTKPFCLLGGPSSIAYQYQEEPTSIIALLWGPPKWPTTCTERFIIVGWAWASNTWLMFYFVMAHSRIVTIYCLGYKIDKPNLLMHNNYLSPHQRYRYHKLHAVTFLQPRQLLWLHMNRLSFMLKSWAESLTFISAIYARPLPEAIST